MESNKHGSRLMAGGEKIRRAENLGDPGANHCSVGRYQHSVRADTVAQDTSHGGDFIG